MKGNIGYDWIKCIEWHLYILKYICCLVVSLVEAVYLEYARLLSNLGYREAAEHYCTKAGEKGEQFLKEVKILFT